MTAVSVTLSLDHGIYAGIASRAAKMNRDPKTFIRQLIDAAYAARVGRERNMPVGDLEMDDAVRAVFCLAGEFDVKRISKATGYSVEFCDNVLRGWKQALAEPAPAKAEPPDCGDASVQGERAYGYTPELKARIAELWAAGMTADEIGAAVGKTGATIGMFASKNRDLCPRRLKL